MGSMTLVIFSLFSFPDQRQLAPTRPVISATKVAEMTGLGGEDWNEERSDEWNDELSAQ